jgi:predicted CXXCH cytochrome family protein
MNKRSICGGLILSAFMAILAAAAIADDQKESDGPEACIACHQSGGNFRRNFTMWKTSGHSKTLTAIINNNQASPDCYGCHSDEGYKAKSPGEKVDVALKQGFSPVTCTTCHNLPHDGKVPRQLVTDPETLCTSCHTQRAILQGKGARGIEEARSFHSAVDCVSCHMSETNHLMKVIRPDDPDVSDKRMDTCTACHKDNNRKARISQLQGWQSSYKESMDPLQADLNTISAALKQDPNLLDAQMKQKLSDVRFNLSLLTRDGSRGSHNIDLTAEIFSNASKDLRALKSAMQPGQPGSDRSK